MPALKRLPLIPSLTTHSPLYSTLPTDTPTAQAMEMTPTSNDHHVNDDPINFSPLNGSFSNSRKDQKRAKAISDAIDKSLRADKERREKEGGIKLLILGKIFDQGNTTLQKT